MKTLVLCNQKGGVGKSAVATLLAHHLVHRGRRVLAIDLDHQANFTKPLRLSGRATASAFSAEAVLAGTPPAVPDKPFVLVPGDRALLGLERQPALHTPFARNVRAFLAAVDTRFDVCVIDTNPNPDIRVIAALASADFVVSPIQLNQEAMDGVSGLLNHDRVGLRKIKAVLNPKLALIGLLPTMVEPTPFQRANFTQIVQQYHALMIRIGDGPGAFPTVTEISRASLLCGRVCNGTAVNEKPGFATHPALVAQSPISHPPKLFHKGDLSVDGNLSSDVRSALANPSQKVVGVVYNAVDDHLSGPDQLHQRWSLDDLRLLLPLLREARDSRRILVVTADHGHVLEDGSAMLTGGQSDRWRAGAAAADAREVALAGDRVLTPDGAKQVVCLWSETARFTGRKNGYHGGASPAEVIVPLSVFTPSGVNVEGWSPAPNARRK